MSFKTRIALALGCAVLAVLLMVGYAASVRGEATEQRRAALEQYGGTTATVYVASRDIVKGETFSERNVEQAEWLVDLLPSGAITEGSELLGKTAASSIAQNSPVSLINVSDSDAALDVPAGMVAVSVPCSNESAVGGALTAGSVIDIYVVSSDSAHLLCQDIQVLKTNAEGTSASLSWAIVAADPSEVEALIAASNLQRLYFVLPSEGERERRAAALSAPSGNASQTVIEASPSSADSSYLEDGPDIEDGAYVEDGSYVEDGPHDEYETYLTPDAEEN